MPFQDRHLRVVIVDDEAAALRAIGELLESCEAIEVVGRATSVTEAQQVVAASGPDVVFMDVEMPRGGAVELLRIMSDETLLVVVTAYDDYAVDAFEWGAADFLLKPVTNSRLERCIARLIRRKAGQPVEKTAAPASKHLFERPLPLPAIGGTRLVLQGNMLWIEANNNSSEVHLADGTSVFTRRRLAAWEAELPPSIFLRVSRSLIVCTGRIAMVRWRSQGGTKLEFNGSSERLVLGRAAAERLKQALDEQNRPAHGGDEFPR